MACDENAPAEKVFVTKCVPRAHNYDIKCLTQLFELASKDETLFPARCCKIAIRIEDVGELVDAHVLENYRNKAAEYTTKNRLYCPNPRCSRFLGSADEATSQVASSSTSRAAPVTICQDCKTHICVACKSYSHPVGTICYGDQDKDSKELLSLAEEVGWRRCLDCHALVELSHG